METAPLSLTFPDIKAVCNQVIERPGDWPNSAQVDIAGVQLILAARLSHVTIPVGVLRAEHIMARWRDLGLEAVMPLPHPLPHERG